MSARLNLYPATVNTPDGTYVGRAFVNDDLRARVYVDQGSGMAIAAEAQIADMGGVTYQGSGELTTTEGAIWKISIGGVSGCGCSSYVRRWSPELYGEPETAAVGELFMGRA